MKRLLLVMGVLCATAAFAGWCQQCVAVPLCMDACDNPIVWSPYWQYCGSYDHDTPQACTDWQFRNGVCMNCPEDPATPTKQYDGDYRLAFVCTGSDPCY
jgi:hypothetical protein